MVYTSDKIFTATVQITNFNNSHDYRVCNALQALRIVIFCELVVLWLPVGS